MTSDMTTALTEDDIYRTSSQYRLWSFSPETLASLRRKTHSLALERARQYDSSRAPAVNIENGVTSDGTVDGGALDCLTNEEEMRLVQKYCDQIRATSDHFKWPVNVKATAVQYLKRFYLSNSCMTYPPKEIYKTALFLACKTEATHMTLSEYARRISTDPEHVLAPEYKVMQALRFTLDVRQPFRGLKGVLMEMLNLAAGLVGAVEGGPTVSGEALKEEMAALAPPTDMDLTPWKAPGGGKMDENAMNDRVQAAYSAARTVLDAPALLTDAYLLYTPSQILLAAMQLADSTLTSFYLGTKLEISSPLRPKVLATIQACVDLLASHDKKNVLTKDERAELEKKLEICRDPATRDLVKAFAAVKQGGGEGNESDEKAMRKKAEREKNLAEGDAFFGPGLSVTNGAKG